MRITLAQWRERRLRKFVARQFRRDPLASHIAALSPQGCRDIIDGWRALGFVDGFDAVKGEK